MNSLCSMPYQENKFWIVREIRVEYRKEDISLDTFTDYLMRCV